MHAIDSPGVFILPKAHTGIGDFYPPEIYAKTKLNIRQAEDTLNITCSIISIWVHFSNINYLF